MSSSQRSHPSELRESELLAWGAVGAEWQRDELLSVLSEHGDAKHLLTQMLESALVVQTPAGGFRTRSAETMRILATLRQAFRGERILNGRPLVLDYRFLQRPRRRPDETSGRPTSCPAYADSSTLLGSETVRRPDPARGLGLPTAVDPVDPARPRANARSGVVVTAGTGSGKTLAFYLPLLAWLADNADSDRQRTTALALYPRNELLKDQLQTLLEFFDHAGQSSRIAPPLSIATWFGPTPVQPTTFAMAGRRMGA